MSEPGRPPRASGPASALSAPSEADARARVIDDLLWAINHALSNRVAALTSMLRILQYSETGLDPLLGVLAKELAQLERTAELLRLLPRTPDEQPEPILLADVLPDVIELHRLQGEPRDRDYPLSGERDLPPVWAERSPLVHLLLLLLAGAARHARGAPDAGVTIACTAQEDRVTVTIVARGQEQPASRDSRATPAPPEAQDPSGLDSLLAASGAELATSRSVTGSEELLRFELRLLTLAEIRRREALGGSD